MKLKVLRRSVVGVLVTEGASEAEAVLAFDEQVDGAACFCIKLVV